MNKYHDVQSLNFAGEWMILVVDGQTYHIPIEQTSSRLVNASEAARQIYQVSPSGYGIHWPILDEDLSIDGLLKLAQTQPMETPAS
jgi:hypothetical protein